MIILSAHGSLLANTSIVPLFVFFTSKTDTVAKRLYGFLNYEKKRQPSDIISKSCLLIDLFYDMYPTTA